MIGGVKGKRGRDWVESEKGSNSREIKVLMRKGSDSFLGNRDALGRQSCILNSQFFPLVVPKDNFP